MDHETARRGRQPVDTDGFLTRLLETEATLATKRAAAEQEAARIRAEARERVLAAETAFPRELDAACGSLEREFAERRTARLALLESEARRRVDTLRALPEAEVNRIASELLERVLRDAAGGGP